METQVLLQAFREGLARYGLAGAVAGTACVFLAGAVGYYLKARVDLMRSESAAAAAEREREARARDAERAALMAEVAEGRRQLGALVENHLAHDSQERGALARIMAELSAENQQQIAALKQIAEDLKAHRLGTGA